MHAVLSSDEISFVADDTSFPNAIRVMAANKTKFSDLNWGFATLGNRHLKVNIILNCLYVLKVLFNVSNSYNFKNFQPKGTQFSSR